MLRIPSTEYVGNEEVLITTAETFSMHDKEKRFGEFNTYRAY